MQIENVKFSNVNFAFSIFIHFEYLNPLYVLNGQS